nr:hypothetical protein [Tanacetum cinerariifolium]
MRTRSQSRNNFPQQEASPAIVEPLCIEIPFLEDQFQEDPPENPPEVPMADNRTMAELLQAPTEGACPHHGFSELHQFDTFYNALNVIDQDSLNSVAGVVAKVSTSSSTLANSFDVAEIKDIVRALLLDKKNQSSVPAPSPTPALVKAVYVKANDEILRNMQRQGQNTQNQCQNMQNQYQIQMANLTDMLSKFVSSNTASSSGSWTLPSNTITNPKEDLKGITTRSGVAYQGPIIPTPFKVVKQGTEVTKDQVQTPSSQSTAPIQPPVAQSKTQTLISELVVAPDMSFEISFTDALILMPKFSSTLKALIGNKEKLSEMARTSMNEHCSVIILNKLPRKLGDPSKFIIPCEFSGMDECLALVDLGASINLMPLSVWEELSLLELTPTCMTLELADRSTSRAMIDVHKGELTLRIENEAITYNLDQTARYSANYNQMTANKIDVIDMACEEYSQEFLGFFDVTLSGNPTPYDDLIVSTTSPTLTSFGDSDFLLFEEADAFLDLKDDPNSPKINPF